MCIVVIIYTSFWAHRLLLPEEQPFHYWTPLLQPRRDDIRVSCGVPTLTSTNGMFSCLFRPLIPRTHHAWSLRPILYPLPCCPPFRTPGNRSASLFRYGQFDMNHLPVLSRLTSHPRFVSPAQHIGLRHVTSTDVVRF
ncbi:hypothetical protein BD779DRAFT_754241 [Infundibulicybe gibba]|nr:hypothetical protein BD779DRAFT_754241 [Infundibulicybe gibba]